MDPKDLKALIKLCRKEGVLHYKSPELEFTLSAQVNIKKSLKTENDKIIQDPQPNEEDVLFWSAGMSPNA
jgi:hypothetical protein